MLKINVNIFLIIPEKKVRAVWYTVNIELVCIQISFNAESIQQFCKIPGLAYLLMCSRSVGQTEENGHHMMRAINWQIW